jgi:carboxylate-amine ligase
MANHDLNEREAKLPAVAVEVGMHFVDTSTFELAPVADQVLAMLARSRARLRPNVLRSCMAVSAGPVASVEDLETELHRALDEVRLAAGLSGAHVLLASSFPLAADVDDLMDPLVRANAFSRRRELLQRQLVQGLVISLDLGTEAAAKRAKASLAHHLPLLLALSGSSPFWAGRDTGFASARIELLDLGLRGETPPVEVSGERVLSPRDLWFDLRSAANPAVLEVRICDVPHTVAEVATLAALAQHLAAEAQRWPEEAPAPYATWMHNRRQALRFGLDAVLQDEHGGRRTARSIAVELATWAPPRLAAGLKMILALGNGAARQRAHFATSGALEAVVAAVVSELDVRVEAEPALN